MLKADDILFLLPFIVILVTYILFFVSTSHKQKYSDKLFRGLKKFHFVVMGAIVFFWMLSKFGIHINANYLSESLAWMWLLSACAMIVSYRFTKHFMQQSYLNVLLFSPLLLIISWIIPMFGFLVNYSFADKFYPIREEIYFNDANYQIRFDHILLGFDYGGELWEKRGLLRVNQGDLPEGWTFGKEVRRIEKDGNNRFHFYYLDEIDQVEMDTVIVVK